MERQSRAYGYALAAVLCWSTVASAFKLTLMTVSPDMLVFLASWVSLLVLLVIVVVTGRLTELTDWTLADWRQSALLGFLNPCLYYLILFRAYDLLPAQEAQPLNMTWPIVLTLMSALILRQRLSAVALMAMSISLLGVLVISTRGNLLAFQMTDGRGVALALVSTLVWAAYWAYGVKDQRDPITRLCVNFVFGALFVSVYQGLTGEITLPPLSGLLGAAYIGLFEMGVTFVLWLNALKLSRTTAEVSRLIFLTPFLSLIVIHFTVGEPIYPSTLVGLVLIVVGILIQQYQPRLAAWLKKR